MMRQSDRIAREKAFTDALRIAAEIVGDNQADPQMLLFIAAIKRLRDERPVRVASLERFDYLEKVQADAHGAWMDQCGDTNRVGPEHDAEAVIDTPLGPLSCRTWRERWANGKIAWKSIYSLAGEPITIREIKDAGLAQRPTTRTRQKKEPAE
jgi:hypothetical protein